MSFDFKALDTKLAGAKEWLGREYQGLRTGRTTPAILDSVSVQAYGSMMPLKQVATIGVEDARTLRVQAFDPGIIKDIERAISQADLGLGIGADAAGVRVSFPELTSERREQLVKLAKAKLEDARTTVRLGRDECWKDIQEQEKLGGMSEDDKFRLKEEMQKKVDDANAELEKLFDKKETEMSS
ncbi:ribosome recycling factor [Candidatus Kaiserbacteria bacterium RIFCSPHIGHO2_01_FULL_56_24]|uniref:Ribosome recycling factor n=1 Tax=Candidatus Kaiserbacteria bacterium RIFCSPHIGHO2_01_FULL_56_24 TaxID=1798487 RepID=A0A1F6DGR9_9BACT|nr:MAG: ribosome recycling factor [Candidatus Kaiserbacteria bacterium RIFCSPHIGHO2_01_FULL_56_24]